MMSGWSLKRIQHEAHRRAWAGYGDESTYHPLRDGKREQDWEWAVEWLWRRLEISAEQRSAAYRFYEAQQTMLGDVAPDPRGMALGETEDRYARASRIRNEAVRYVEGHPDLTPLRQRTFIKLFDVSQPTLESVRSMGAKRTNQREAIARVRWCLEVLANCFDGVAYEQEGAVSKQIGVGEGWTRYEYLDGMVGEARAALERQGLQTFVSPSGALYGRDPHAASVFQPLDSTPQIAPSKS